jgi:hypothetical protein
VAEVRAKEGEFIDDFQITTLGEVNTVVKISFLEGALWDTCPTRAQVNNTGNARILKSIFPKVQVDALG